MSSRGLPELFGRRPLAGIRVVDAHAHAGPYSRFFIPDHDLAGMVDVMDRCGITVALIASHLAIELDAARGNAETAALVDGSGGRLRGLLTVNPHQDPEQTLHRWLDDPRFVGVKLHPDLQRYPVTGPRYAPVWDAAAGLGFPVLVHSWAGSAYNDVPMFGEIAERHPGARILLGHAGGSRGHFDDVAELAVAYPDLVVETCGTFMTGDWLRSLVRRVGADRVVFGSDFPFIDLRYAIGRVLFAELTDAELEQVLGASASRLVHRFRPADPAFT